MESLFFLFRIGFMGSTSHEGLPFFIHKNVKGYTLLIEELNTNSSRKGFSLRPTATNHPNISTN